MQSVRSATPRKGDAMILKIELDAFTQEALIKAAIRDRRPLFYEAEILIMRALGITEPDEADQTQVVIQDTESSVQQQPDDSTAKQ